MWPFKKPTMKIAPYPDNAKKHPREQIKKIAQSIKRFGMNQPIVVDKQGFIIVGHGRYQALQYLGWEVKDEWVRVADHLTENEVKAYRLADNKLNESDWDYSLVEEELALLATLDKELAELTGFDMGLDLDEEGIYTTKTEKPTYEPRGEQPPISELVDPTKMDTLHQEIEASSLSDEEKDFLHLASYRHNIFDYAKIADFYAHASPEMQDLMEKSALVIIDFDKAIENGFVELEGSLKTQYESEYGG